MKLILILSLLGTANADWRRKIHNFCEQHLIANDPNHFRERAVAMTTEELLEVRQRIWIRVLHIAIEEEQGVAKTFKQMAKDSRDKLVFKSINDELSYRGVK